MPPADLALMRRMDELHLEFPFAGSRMLRDLLAAEGSKAGRRHTSTLMGVLGIEAVYRKPSTTKPAPGHKIYPYLLRGLTIDRPTRLGDRHHLHSDGARVRLSVRWARAIGAVCHILSARSAGYGDNMQRPQPPRPVTEATIARLKEIFAGCLESARAAIGDVVMTEEDIAFAIRDDVMSLLNEDASE